MRKIYHDTTGTNNKLAGEKELIHLFSTITYLYKYIIF